MPRSGSYDDLLMAMLKDKGRSASYLNAAIEDGDHRGFLVALRNVVQARGGVGQVARQSGLNRESLYRTLSEKGNPSLASLSLLLGAVGIRLTLSRSRGKPEHPQGRTRLHGGREQALPKRKTASGRL